MNLNSETIEIKGSPAKLVGLVVLGIIMTGASGMIAFGIIPNVDGSFIQFIGWFGLLFFGACLLVAVSRFFASSKTVVTLSPEGLLDTRVAQKPIPWSEMQDIGVWESNGQKVIVISVPHNVELQLGLTFIARKTRGANAKLGADGLCLVSTGLKISHDDLLDLIMIRADAARFAA